MTSSQHAYEVRSCKDHRGVKSNLRCVAIRQAVVWRAKRSQQCNRLRDVSQLSDDRLGTALRDRTGHAAPHGPSSAAGHIGGVALNAVTRLVRLGTGALVYAALGVFFRFQIPGFDLSFGFFSLCHFIFPSYLFWVVCLCVGQ